MAINAELKKIAQDFFDQIWNQGDESASFREQWKNWRKAFPDINFEIQELVADEETDTVVSRWALTGTHSDEFWGAAATGKKIKVDGVSIDRIKDGMVVPGFDAWDSMVLRRQIGLAE